MLKYSYFLVLGYTIGYVMLYFYCWNLKNPPVKITLSNNLENVSLQQFSLVLFVKSTLGFNICILYNDFR
jgi:hypothetical protein